MFTISSFRSIENKHNLYRGKDWKNICKSLREHTLKIMLKRKKIKLLTKEQQELYENKMFKYVIFEKKNLKINIVKL